MSSHRWATYIALRVVLRHVLGVKVERRRAEEARRELARQRFVDSAHRICEEGAHVVIPVLSAPPAELLRRLGAELVESDFSQRLPRKDPIDEILDRVDIPEALKPLLPRKWELFGDVLVLKLDRALDPHEKAVADAYAQVLRAKSVLRDVGGISGELRQPGLRLLLGEDTVTTHVENGVRFRFDVAQIMFSSGNMEERIRMSQIRCDGETVVDMFAGIGYFSLPLAVYQKPRRVIACELNPVAYSYLSENIRLNRVAHIVEPILGDNRSLDGESFADRIIMGYVKTTHEYLPAAMRMLRSGGMIHYHETCPRELLPHRPIQRLTRGLAGARVEINRVKEVKSFAPGVSHVVVDARVFKDERSPPCSRQAS
ncbi:MAG: class I SAM-dependent methyltransferase family protein [Thermoplasmata archaeon]